MKTYRCVFLDAGGNAFGSEELHAEDDAAAIARARIVFTTSLVHSHQIWEGDRLVHHQRPKGGPE